MIKTDTHLHTLHSHGKAGVTEMFHAARKKGIDIIGFSEHSPRPETHSYPSDYQPKLIEGFPTYVADVKRLREEFKNEATVLFGLEMDWMEGSETFIADTLKAHDFDYVIGGIHFLDTWGFDYRKEDWQVLSEAQQVSLYNRFFCHHAGHGADGPFQHSGPPRHHQNFQH